MAPQTLHKHVYFRGRASGFWGEGPIGPLSGTDMTGRPGEKTMEIHGGSTVLRWPDSRESIRRFVQIA